MLSKILKQLTRLSGSKPADKIAANNDFYPVGTIKSENIFASDKGKAKAKAENTNPTPPTNTIPPVNEPLVPKVSGEFPLPTHTEGQRNDTLSSTQIQFFNAPPSANNKKFLANGTINLYPPVNAQTSGLTDQEMRVKRYFLIFSHARKPRTPMNFYVKQPIGIRQCSPTTENFGFPMKAL
ncbi:hypothetical protein K3495_g1301 [Podosphaera aphanis]|nr:hypothetical protein K3495_g1301 [Podosphaera aphanis]